MRRLLSLVCVALCVVVGGVAAAEPIVFENAKGDVLCTIEPGGERYAVYGEGRQPLGTIRVEADRTKLKDAQDRDVLKVKRKESGAAEVQDGSGRQLFKAKLDEDGTWKLKDPSGTSVVKMKRKTDGYEVRTDAGDTIAKVKSRDGRLVYETEAGERRFVAKGITDARAGMWLVVDRLRMAERAALAVYFLRVQGEW